MARHPNPNPNPNSHPNPNPYPNPRRSRSCSRASPPCRSSIFLPTVRHRSSLTPTPTPTLTLSLTPTLTLTLTPTPTRTLTLPLTRPLLGRGVPGHHLHLPLRLGAKGQPLRRRRRHGRTQVSAARAPHAHDARSARGGASTGVHSVACCSGLAHADVRRAMSPCAAPVRTEQAAWPEIAP